VLPAGVDAEVHGAAGLRSQRVADDLRGLVRDDDFRRRSIRGVHTQHLVQLTAVEHLPGHVATPRELTVDVKLRNRRPAGELLDPLANFLVFEHVHGGVLRQQGIEDAHGGGGKAALGHLWRAFHEKHHAVGLDDGFDALLERFTERHAGLLCS
jgi:hypothetical protein